MKTALSCREQAGACDSSINMLPPSTWASEAGSKQSRAISLAFAMQTAKAEEACSESKPCCEHSLHPERAERAVLELTLLFGAQAG